MPLIDDWLTVKSSNWSLDIEYFLNIEDFSISHEHQRIQHFRAFQASDLILISRVQMTSHMIITFWPLVLRRQSMTPGQLPWCSYRPLSTTQFNSIVWKVLPTIYNSLLLGQKLDSTRFDFAGPVKCLIEVSCYAFKMSLNIILIGCSATKCRPFQSCGGWKGSTMWARAHSLSACTVS